MFDGEQDPRNRKLKESWRYKMMVFYLRISGLSTIYFGSNGLLRKLVYCIRLASFFLQGVFVLHCVISFIQHIITYETQVKLRELIFYVEYGILAAYVFDRDRRVLLKSGSEIVWLLRDTRLGHKFDGRTKKLRQEKNERAELSEVLEKYSNVHNIFCIGYLLTIQTTVILTAIVSPFIRFVIRNDKPTYVFRRVWYPDGVLEKRKWFWCAAIYEWTVIFDSSNAILIPDLLFLFLCLRTAGEFDYLCQFLGRISLPQLADVKGSAQSFNTAKYEEDGPRKLSFIRLRDHFNEAVKTNMKVELLKEGIHDWNRLWRRTEVIKKVFAPVLSCSQFAGVFTNTLMTYIAITELRSLESNSKIAQSGIFFYHVMTSIFLLYTMSYGGAMLQTANDNIRLCLWQSNWFEESLTFQQLSLLFNRRLLQPIKIKLFSIQDLNIESFSHNLSLSFSYITFLLQLSRTS